MAAFIVISADNRLHYLVDGIEKCRPLNPDVSTNISTGKITKSDTGYIYEYTIHGEGLRGDGAKSFSNLLANQLAAFRLAYNIQQDEVVNIFLLENPLTENDLAESESWIEEFDKVFCAGQGHDTSFRLYRLIFTYNHDNPTDIESQIDRDTLKKLLSKHKETISCEHTGSSERSFDRYIFYIDNQKSDSAALCLYKEEHDLKMPRFLTDFMMLASSSNDFYNIINAINSSSENTRCFSVGFAESMYYYPDVEYYYKHADNRDLHCKFLKNNDETQGNVSKEAMNVEKHPFGLYVRKQRLAKYYDDISFFEDIELYPESSDRKINDCIVGLQGFLFKEREKEIEDFHNSADVISLQKSIDNYTELINSAKQKADETPEEFDKKIKGFCLEKDRKTKELNDLLSSFEPECPSYIDRSIIYTNLCVAGKDEAQDKVAKYSEEYNKLVDFAKSRKFMDFVKANIPQSSNNFSGNYNNFESQGSTPSDRDCNSGCLSKLFPWLRSKSSSVEKLSQYVMNTQTAPTTKSPTYTDMIICINEQLDLKSAYATFKMDVNAVENIYTSEKGKCDSFKLTEHTNHYYPLIDIVELQNFQSSTFSERLEKGLHDWREQATPTKTSLVTIVEKAAGIYTKTHFSFIDWENPFPFVKDITAEGCMENICNELQKRAAPFVNYNLTSALKENKVIRLLYSDRPNFESEIEKIRPKLQNGNEIAPAKSTHIASKICMMQILPLDQDMLDHLVDLQENEKTDILEIVSSAGHISTNNNTQGNKTPEPPIINWGNDDE